MTLFAAVGVPSIFIEIFCIDTYTLQPGHCLGHLIGHEGPGSLLSELKSRGILLFFLL